MMDLINLPGAELILSGVEDLKNVDTLRSKETQILLTGV
jgi:hypothetical protein